MGSSSRRSGIPKTLRAKAAVNARNIFSELKRRNVYRVAVAYAVIGWLLIQVTTQVFPFLEIPNWAIRFVILLTALGFPVALIIAWAFELTPEGIKRTGEIEPGPRSRNRTWIYIVVIGGAISIGLFFLGRFTAGSGQRASDGVPGKSIAVLPFENLSEEKGNAYFAEGIQDEILTRLAKIADLKVISRKSTQRFKSSTDNLPDIAKQLGVANILQGSVQKAADQARVTVQLINALNDSHLWAETYDRKLIDVFQVESDIAQKIAASLEAKLTGREMHDIMAGGTKNPEAFDAYLRARALVNKQSLDRLDKIIQFCRRAVELDPNYAEAWATLAIAEAEKYFIPDTTQMQLEQARNAAGIALRLAPESADAHAAMGMFYYYCLQDFDRALAELTVAHERAPNDGNILAAIGLVQRRQGKLVDSIKVQQQGAKLDPLNEDIWVNLGRSYRGIREFDRAHTMFDRALTIIPNDTDVLRKKAETYLAQGDINASSRLVSGSKFSPRTIIGGGVRPQSFYVQWHLDRGQFDDAITQLASTLATEKNLPPLLVAIAHTRLGDLHLLKGDGTESQALYLEAERDLKTLRAQGENGLILVDTLIEVEARLGHRHEVEHEANTLLERTRKDAWRFPLSEEVVARAYAILGDADRAIPLLKDALSAPCQEALTPALLRLNPLWDPLRNDPRFQELIVEKKNL
jgi:TolB-like protein/Flp pilus assembly protein TadD